MTKWQEVKLRAVCLQITDGVHNTVKDDETGEFYLLSCKNIKNGNIFIGEKERRINKQTLEILRKRTKTAKGDVLLSSVGTIGETAIIKEDAPLYEFQRSVAIFKPNPQYITSEFLFYSLNNKKKILQYSAEGAVQQCLFINPLKEFEIPLPSLEIQKKISEVLGALDDKIELNNKINNNLEQQAQALYLDKVEKYKDKEIKVEDIVVTANTGADAIQKAPIVDYDTGIKCVRVGDMSNKRSHHDWGYTKISDEVFTQYQLKKDDIIVTRTASLGLNTIISKDLNAVYNNGLIRLSINKEKIIPLLVYRQFQTTDFENYISKIEGETSVRPNMKINYLLQYNFSIINKEKQEELVNILKPIWERQEQLKEENEKLTQLRDTLLPKLMSGEIDVSKVNISADKLSFTED